MTLRQAQGPDKIQPFGRLRGRACCSPSTSSGSGHDAALRHAQGPGKIQPFDKLRVRA
ncbi:MAG: hypothetical protein ACKO16_05780 [Gemmataceae bacterium]